MSRHEIPARESRSVTGSADDGVKPRGEGGMIDPVFLFVEPGAIQETDRKVITAAGVICCPMSDFGPWHRQAKFCQAVKGQTDEFTAGDYRLS
jgi:hypothetical protein